MVPSHVTFHCSGIHMVYGQLTPPDVTTRQFLDAEVPDWVLEFHQNISKDLLWFTMLHINCGYITQLLRPPR